MRHKSEGSQTTLPVSRRRVLELTAGLALALAPIIRMRHAEAQGTSGPRRLIIIGNSLGHEGGSWGATGTETSFKLLPVLEVLEKYKAKMNVLEGLDLKYAPGIDPGGHEQHRALLTNAPSANAGAGSSGPSIDQIIGAKMIGKTAISSISMGYRCYSGQVYATPCYSASGQRVDLIGNTAAAFKSLFEGFMPPSASPTPDPMAPKRAALEKSMLDALMSDVNDMKARLSGAEKAKLDDHLTSLRALEARTSKEYVAAPGCGIPKRPSYEGSEDALESMKLFNSIIAQAVACDRTRVFTMQLGMEGETGGTWPGLKSRKSGIAINPHSASHHENGHTGEDLLDLSLVKARAVLDLCDRLAAITEGESNALDNSVVLWTSANAFAHSGKNLPTVLIGGCGGAFKTGRYLRFPRENHARVLLSLAEAMGTPVASLGNRAESMVTQPLSVLKG